MSGFAGNGYAGPGEINWDPLDRYTFGHFAVGAGLGVIKATWWQALLAAVAWDLLERGLKHKWPGMWPHPSQDTPQHIAVDAAAWMLGWATTRQFVRGFGPGDAPLQGKRLYPLVLRRNRQR